MRGESLRARMHKGSALRGYQDLVVGSRSWLALIRHEFVAGWGAKLPGAAGLAFRKLLWPSLFHQLGRGTVFGQDVIVRHPGKMTFASDVVVDDNCYLDAKGCGPGQFVVAHGAMISRGCLLSAKEGGISIGERATVGASCVFYSFGGIEIGADTMIAAQCYIGGGRYDPRGSLEVPMHRQPLPGRGVVIEEDCWLGAGVTVVDGVRIGRGSIIAAGAVVTRDVVAETIVAGVPAKSLGPRFPDEITH